MERQTDPDAPDDRPRGERSPREAEGRGFHRDRPSGPWLFRGLPGRARRGHGFARKGRASSCSPRRKPCSRSTSVAASEKKGRRDQGHVRAITVDPKTVALPKRAEARPAGRPTPRPGPRGRCALLAVERVRTPLRKATDTIELDPDGLAFGPGTIPKGPLAIGFVVEEGSEAAKSARDPAAALLDRARRRPSPAEGGLTRFLPRCLSRKETRRTFSISTPRGKRGPSGRCPRERARGSPFGRDVRGVSGRACDPRRRREGDPMDRPGFAKGRGGGRAPPARKRGTVVSKLVKGSSRVRPPPRVRCVLDRFRSSRSSRRSSRRRSRLRSGS